MPLRIAAALNALFHPSRLADQYACATAGLKIALFAFAGLAPGLSPNPARREEAA